MRTIQETCAHLRLSTSTLYRLRRDGRLKFVRIGQQVRITDDAIADLLRDGAA